MRLCFIDVDGVLNDHERHANGYCGVKAECVARLNELLRLFPDVLLVVSSSWRYLVLNGSCTLDGLTNLFLTHGLDCFGRLHGVTASDEEICGGGRPVEYLKEHGAEIRREQIYRYARAQGAARFVVLDDLDLRMPELVRTEGAVGLTADDVERAAALLR